MSRLPTPVEFALNEINRKNNLRDEFALRLAPTVFDETFCITYNQYAEKVYLIADAMVKESEKYRNGEKEVNKDD